MARTIELPANLIELAQNPEKLKAAQELLNAISNATQELTVPNTTNNLSRGLPMFFGDGSRPLISRIPLKFAKKITAASGGATVDANARAVLSDLIDQFTLTGQNPP